jgi:2-succinyl-6-hydroxy-2,4-cyclohexadiene-1-carboxylate synthase
VLHVDRYRSRPHRAAGVARHPDDPVLLLHGFTQSGGAWQPVVDDLTAAGHEVVTVDAPGHGRSADVRADLWASAELIVEAAGPGTYVGYSMGARLALHVALAHPEALRRLVLVSGTGGIDQAEQRAQRRRSDELIASRIERDGLEAFVRWWLERPLFATLPAEAAAIDSRLTGTAAGLAASLRLAGTGTQEPLWDRLEAIGVPTLVVVGGLDATYRGPGERLVGAIGPNATLAVIPGAGHAVHLERPAELRAVLAAFLDGTA